MNRFVVVISVLMLTACAQIPPYTYTSQSEIDPEITFGDRFGGGKISSPARSFAVNFSNAATNKCKDFVNVGVTSNHWMGVAPKTRQIRVPAGKEVAIRSFWTFSTSSCIPSVLKFTPENSGKYSVDVAFVGSKCYLSIAQHKADGKLEEIKEISVLPECTN